jgi:hypothetical protein
MHACLAEKINSDLKMISSSYYQLIDQNSFYSKFNLNIKYINRAINISKSLLTNISDYQSLAKLHYLSFINHFAKGKINIAIQHGLIAKNLLYHIHDNDTLLRMFPELILCSIYYFKSLESIKKLLAQFESIIFESNQLVALLCYDCLCLDISFSFNEENNAKLPIEHFIKKLNDPLFKNEILMNFYFNSTLTIYYCRKNDFINAEKFYRASVKSKLQIKLNSFLYASSILKLIEYQLVLFSQLITEYSFKVVMKLKFHDLLVRFLFLFTGRFKRLFYL